jgi:hypothetical protein
MCYFLAYNPRLFPTVSLLKLNCLFQYIWNCAFNLEWNFLYLFLLLKWPALGFRHDYPWWKEKVIDSDLKRKDGLCPLTPEVSHQVFYCIIIGPCASSAISVPLLYIYSCTFEVIPYMQNWVLHTWNITLSPCGYFIMSYVKCMLKYLGMDASCVCGEKYLKWHHIHHESIVDKCGYKQVMQIIVPLFYS